MSPLITELLKRATQTTPPVSAVGAGIPPTNPTTSNSLNITSPTRTPITWFNISRAGL